MKYQELIRTISRIAKRHQVEWRFHREGGNHEIWRFHGKTITIPRHRDIDEELARKIIRDCERLK